MRAQIIVIISIIFLLYLVKIKQTSLKEIDLITEEYLELKRNSMELSKYLKYLKKIDAKVTVSIISKAEKGAPRDLELEKKLTIIQEKIKQYENK